MTTPIIAPTFVERSMRHMKRSSIGRTVLVAAVATLLGACSERPPQAARGGTLTAPTTSLRTVTGAPLVLGCMPVPGIAARAVSAGTRGDENHNGVVCERRVGAPGRDRILTSDDVLVPAAPAKGR